MQNPQWFLAAGPGPPTFFVENKGNIKKEEINSAKPSAIQAAARLGPPLQITFLHL